MSDSINIGPKIGIDGYSEFRRQITEINTYYKSLTAETKALTAAWDANGDEQGKLEAQSKQLTKQIELKKKAITLLEDAIASATAKYGESSIEATRLRTALYNTQAAVSGLESDLTDVNQRLAASADGMDELADEADDAGSSLDEFGTIFGAALSADLVGDILRESAEALKDFGIECIGAAADVQASEAQFSQAFGDIEGAAASALKSISDDTGIAVTRMRSSFTMINAFAKTTGADSNKALSIASRAMVAAADSAAYYDKSIEEATEQLQSFLKGNYENDAALGISATETTRNAKANEMYAQSFKDLSEAQKVDVLLSMVEAGNAVSGALGQAAREAGSYTNVTGELTEAWKQFQAALGEPVLDAVIPVIQSITAALKDMAETSAWKDLSGDLADFLGSFESADQRFAVSAAEINGAAFAAKNYIARLDELETAGLASNEAQEEYALIVQRLNELVPDLNLTIDEQTGLVERNTQAVLNDIEAWKTYYTNRAMQDKLTEYLTAYGAAEVELADAKSKCLEIQERVDALEAEYAQQSQANAAWAANYAKTMRDSAVALGLTAEEAEELAGRYDALAESGEPLTGSLERIQVDLESAYLDLTLLDGEVDRGEALLAEYDAKIKDTQEALGVCAEETKTAGEAQSELAEIISVVQAELDELNTCYAEAQATARESIDSQIGLFDELAAESEITAAEIVENWLSQQVAFDNYSANMLKAVDMGLDRVLVDQLSDGSEQSMLVLNELVNGTDISIDEINASFQQLERAKDLTATTMAGIQTEYDSVMAELVDSARQDGINIVEGVARGVEEYAWRFTSVMRSTGRQGVSAFEEELSIHSPSRVMVDDGEYTVDGAVIGVERKISKFEAVMADLASSGQDAFLREQLAYAESFPALIQLPSAGTMSQRRTVNYGGINIQIYQQPGESGDDLADRIANILQDRLVREEAAW